MGKLGTEPSRGEIILRNKARNEYICVTILLIRHDIGLWSRPQLLGSLCIKTIREGQMLHFLSRINRHWCRVTTLDGFAGYVLFHRYYVKPGHRFVKKAYLEHTQ